MPANRSRTAGWRQCLQQVYERNGSIEIAVARDGESDGRSYDLVWRVRILGIDDDEIVVEPPGTMGQSIDLQVGIRLVGIFSIGQNRWMFNTTNLGTTKLKNGRSQIDALRLELPEAVQRCQRRHHYRVETAALELPEVEAWPLLDPKSVILAERANELLIRESQESGDGAVDAKSHGGDAPEDQGVMPDVGPKFVAMLRNIGGGGVGLSVSPDDAPVLARRKLIWMRIVLPPTLSAPICATGKVVHTHIESDQRTYAGIAFDFAFNAAHQHVVIDQIRRSIAHQQRVQMQRKSA